MKDLPDLSYLAISGQEIAIRVTPNARREALEPGESPHDPIKIAVTVVPEAGRATEAAQALLAKAMGVARTRLVLIRGVKSRDKVFRLE